MSAPIRIQSCSVCCRPFDSRLVHVCVGVGAFAGKLLVAAGELAGQTPLDIAADEAGRQTNDLRVRGLIGSGDATWNAIGLAAFTVWEGRLAQGPTIAPEDGSA